MRKSFLLIKGTAGTPTFPVLGRKQLRSTSRCRQHLLVPGRNHFLHQTKLASHSQAGAPGRRRSHQPTAEPQTLHLHFPRVSHRLLTHRIAFQSLCKPCWEVTI